MRYQFSFVIFLLSFSILFLNEQSSKMELGNTLALKKVQSGSIEIEVNGINSTSGHINIALYNTKSDFNIIEKAFIKKAYIISGKSILIKLPNIPTGDYALSIFHDANKNLQIDKNLFGIPKEGFAFSNNATANFGPPDWNAAKFSVLANKTFIQKLKLIYY
jgi:uncharacterized protein (DUF2141 family)